MNGDNASMLCSSSLEDERFHNRLDIYAKFYQTTRDSAAYKRSKIYDHILSFWLLSVDTSILDIDFPQSSKQEFSRPDPTRQEHLAK